MSTGKISEEDRRLFRQACANLSRSQPETQQTKITPKPDSNAFNPRMLQSHQPADEMLGAEDTMRYARPGLQKRILQKLCRGQFDIEDVFDLHGMDIATAHAELNQFLYESKRDGRYVLSVIHGKGKNSQDGLAQLKSHVNHWLKHHDQVLAFCSAKRSDGGAGAVYVLLRRK